MADLTSNTNFPNNPSSVEVIDNFDAPFNVEDNYGARVRGFFNAPESGYYRYVEKFVKPSFLPSFFLFKFQST